MDESLKSRIHDSLVAGRDVQFLFLRELIRTPLQNPPGDTAAVAELTAKTLKSLGFGVERHNVPDGLVRERGLAAITNLVVRHEFASGPVVALNAHGDTGPAGDGWTADPLGGEIKDGVLYGLGALTKAALAVYAHALAALRDARPDLSGTEVAGILCNSSSRRHPDEFTERLEREARSEKARKGETSIFVYDKRVWEIKPNGTYGKKWF